ncbi:MAG: hypothetical protein Q9M92_17740 [Enterobacterales bacterium]|nr:hypothetical protein [Enterobacterales bacterium]
MKLNGGVDCGVFSQSICKGYFDMDNYQSDEQIRKEIQSILESGLKVELEPRAYSHEEILKVVSQLQKLEEKDYQSKLKIAGFTLSPWGDDEQSCETCMYYKVHQKFCEIPELMLPVEPEWSCRLWRI